jgi:hypothetical protein
MQYPGNKNKRVAKHGKQFQKYGTPNGKKTDLSTDIFKLDLERTSVTAVQIEEQLANTQLEAVAVEHWRWKCYLCLCPCLWLCSWLWLCPYLCLCLLLSQKPARGSSKHRSHFLDCGRVSFDVKSIVPGIINTSVACAWVIIASEKIIQIIPAPTKEKNVAKRTQTHQKKRKAVKMESR